MKKILLFILVIIIAISAGLFLWRPNTIINSNSITSTSTASNLKDQKLSDSTDFYTITASYPVDGWDKNEAMKQMVNYLVNQKKEEWKTGGDAYNSEQKIAKDFPDRPKMKYELNISYIATSSEKMKTRSYVFSVYEFTGGAHGNTAITSYNFTKDSQIKIEDAVDFGSGNYVKLAKLLKSKLVTSLAEDANERMINDGFGLNYIKPDGTFDKEKCNCDGYYFPSNVQVFTIHDNGIKFIFSQYQVAPYVFGNPEVMLSWNEIKNFLNKDSYLLKNI